MKKFKIVLLFVTLLSVTFYSCTDNNPIENEVVSQKSIALRTTLNELKAANNIAGKSTTDQAFCFGFVYPISLSYSNRTVVSVSSIEGLLGLLIDENANLYIEGISFPFQVEQQGEVTTISNEDQFYNLLESCGFNTINDDLATTFCFDIVFPVTVTNQNGENEEILNSEAFLAYLQSPASGNQAQIVFPISVLYDGQTVIINDLYGFYEIINSCDQNDCNCTQEYAPICVNTPSGTIEFGNACYALCAGYSQNDLVSCNSSNCTISNLTVTPGSCNTDQTYVLTIDFDYTNAESDSFVVYSSTGSVVGTYLLANLPITISNYAQYNNATDYLVIDLGVTNNCSALKNWILPNCACDCPTDFNPVCVQNPNTGGQPIQFNNACLALCNGYSQNDFINCGVVTNNFNTLLGSCFNMIYPVQVQWQGAVITVNSDNDLLQFSGATGNMPVFNYPVSAIFANSPVILTFTDQAAFAAQINQHCN